MPEMSPTQKKSDRNVIVSGVLFACIALVGVLIVLYAWHLPPFHSSIQTTENATVRGQVTIISPQLSGYIVEVDVQDYQMVRQGQLLLRIDDRIYAQHLAQARAQLATQRAALDNWAQTQRTARATIEQNTAALANAQAQATRSNADLRRVEELATDGSLSARERDAARATRAQTAAATEQARAALEIARQTLRTVDVNRAALEAAVANADAAVKLAEIDLANTRITAPRDGQLGQVSVRLGAFVNAGAQLTALVPQAMWIVANMKETQMADVRLGQAVTFTVDALNHVRLRGHVEQIAPATGSEFSVITPDNATGNFVKIAQRIPVRISIDANQALAARLRPGMSVVTNIDTSGKGRVPGAIGPAPVAAAPATGVWVPNTQIPDGAASAVGDGAAAPGATPAGLPVSGVATVTAPSGMPAQNVPPAGAPARVPTAAQAAPAGPANSATVPEAPGLGGRMRAAQPPSAQPADGGPSR